jgi:hypothetical protein
VPCEERTQEKLRLREPGGRILVLRYLSETRANGGIDREQWRKLNPDLYRAAARDLPDEGEGG